MSIQHRSALVENGIKVKMYTLCISLRRSHRLNARRDEEQPKGVRYCTQLFRICYGELE